MYDPPVPPMRPGLPATSDEACQLLLLSVLSHAFMEDDHAFLLGDVAAVYMKLLGWDDATILAARLAYCRGDQFGPRDFWESRYGAPRFRNKDERLDEAHWQAWGTSWGVRPP